MKILLAVLASWISFAAHAEQPPLEAPYTRTTSEPRRVVEKPDSIDDEGDYHYKNETTNFMGGDRDRAKYYKPDPVPPIESAVFINFGTIGPYDINGDDGKTYKDVYTTKAGFLLGVEYERLIGHLAGKWSWKINSGLNVSQGKGSFAHPNAFYTPEEKFSLFVLPNTATVSYKMHFSDSQLFTPYVDAGAGYFTFVEYRNDGHKTAFGGAPVLTAAGGLLISLTKMDQVAAGTMYEDYGVKHLWFDLQLRRIEGLDKKKDFSSNMVTGGFGFAF